MEDVQGAEIDERLPPRLFVHNRYPSNRLNVYSCLDIIPFLNNTLKGTLVLETLKKSVFGGLFDLPLYQCSISGKLVHGLLSRQVVSKKKFELWTTFGGQPLRFSLHEFGNLTGLPCHEYPEDYDPKDSGPAASLKDPFWIQLIGEDTKTTLADITALIEEDKNIPSWRLLRLAFLLIVDGVLVATHQTNRPTLKYVLLLKDLKTFNEFPWGRESFFHTIKTMKPGSKTVGKGEDPVDIFRNQLKQQTLKMHGFPLALQVLAFKAIPRLDEILHHPNKEHTISDLKIKKIPKQVVLNHNDILEVESSKELKVQPFIEPQELDIEGWGEWDDEVKDRKIIHLEELIENNHCFKPSHWPGGDASMPFKAHEPKQPQRIHKMHIIPTEKDALSQTLKVRKKTTKTNKKGSGRKQTKLPQNFQREPLVPEQSAAEIMEQIQFLVGEVKELKTRTIRLEQKLKRRHKRRFGKLSSRRLGSNRKLVTHRTSSTHSLDAGLFDFQDNLHNVAPHHSPKQDFVYSSTNIDLSPRSVAFVYQEQFGSPTKNEDISMEHDYEVKSKLMDNSVSKETSEKCKDTKEANVTQIDLSENILSTQHREEHPTKNSTKDLESTHEIPGGLGTHEIPDGFEEDDAKVLVDDVCAKAIELVASPTLPLHEDKDLNVVKVQVDNATILASCALPVSEMCETSTTPQTPTITTDALQQRSDVTCFVENPVKHLMPYKRKRSSRNNNIVEEINDSIDEKHCPSPMEINLAKLLQSKPTVKPNDLLPTLDEKAFKVFEETLASCQNVKHHIPNHFSFDNKFLLALTKKQQWISELHMEAMMTLLNRKHASLLAMERACFISPWTVKHFQSKYRVAKKIKDYWDERLSPVVKKPGETWIKDIDTVYAPMLWNETHWVGLVTHLKMWYIQVLDPFFSLYKKERVATFIAPVVEILPHIIAHLSTHHCDEDAESIECTLSQQHGLKPFEWSRITGLYDNKRGGDCGSVAAKFMELHLHDDQPPSMQGITNTMVNHFRKTYAMDIYKEFVLPLYTP